MNDVIRYELSKYLDYNDLLNLSLSCKHFNKILKPILLKKKIKKQEQIQEFFNFIIIDIVNKQNFLKARYIEWNQKWEIENGETFMIDFNEFKGSIAYSKDRYNRSFIFVKVKVENPHNENLPQNNYTIMIIFQKYSDISVYFISDPYNYCITTVNGGIYMEIEYYQHFKNFFLNGCFNYSDFPYEFPFPPLYQKIHIFKNDQLKID